MSCKAPLAWSKASTTNVIPTLRLSYSMLSMAMARVKSIDTGSYGFVHLSKGSPHAGESLPTDIRARDDFPPVPSATDPSRRDVPPRDPLRPP